MGSKSDDKGPTPASRQEEGLALYGAEPGSNANSDLDALSMFSTMMTVMQANQAAAPEVLVAPEVFRTPEVDWTEKQEQLASKARADYKSDKKRRKGRKDTIATSHLLDDEEVKTTGSLVT